MKKWIPSILLNMLLVFTLLVWSSEYRYQLDNENHWPLTLSILTLIAGYVVTKLGDSTLPAWWTKTFLISLLPLFYWGATFIPFLRDPLVLADHRTVASWEEVEESTLGLAKRRHLYTATYGPKLLRDSGVINPYLRSLEFSLQTTNDLDLEKYRAQLSLWYIALRLQGHSAEYIWKMPLGKELTLATMLAETYPPYWWPVADWLKTALPCNPQEGLLLGILNKKTAYGFLQEMAQNPSDFKLAPSSTAKDAVRKEAYLKTLLQLAGRWPLSIPEPQLSSLITEWKRYTEPQFERSFDEAVQLRGAFQKLVKPYVRPNGTLPVVLQLDSLQFNHPYLQNELRQSIVEWIGRTGFKPVLLNEGFPIKVSMVEKWVDSIPSTTTEYHEVMSVEKVRRLSGKNHYTTYYYDRVNYESSTNSQTESLTVALVVLTGNGTTLIGRPYGVVNRNNNDPIVSQIHRRKYEPTTDAFNAIQWYYHILFFTLNSWNLGIYRYEDPDNQLFWDGAAATPSPLKF